MPAGSPKKLALALHYGADAAYLGPAYFSLRARDNEFCPDEIKAALDLAHSQNKKIYLTLNVFARNRKLKPFEKTVQELAALEPDGFIVSDPGLMSICVEKAPQIERHLSVQANCTNWRSARFWHESLEIF